MMRNPGLPIPPLRAHRAARQQRRRRPHSRCAAHERAASGACFGAIHRRHQDMGERALRDSMRGDAKPRLQSRRPRRIPPHLHPLARHQIASRRRHLTAMTNRERIVRCLPYARHGTVRWQHLEIYRRPSGDAARCRASVWGRVVRRCIALCGARHLHTEVSPAMSIPMLVDCLAQSANAARDGWTARWICIADRAVRCKDAR